ncbi:MAG: chemotaxis protein CheW, partial [Rhodospirillales bacterium]|nr:chemotaxis protein CheW [Rhodospirillales bacterium]
IFLPGFSTADQVSNLSGRGVGMDVVKRNIQNLGGRISIRSSPGHGTCFQMTLPLTLAVLDGMIIRVGSENYVLPITSIIETFQPNPAAIKRVAGHGEMLSVRGEYVSLIQIHRLFNVPDAITDPGKAIVVLIETENGQKAGLVVDELLGMQQAVIKSLEQNYDRVVGVAAATILGDGRVALILDAADLCDLSRRQRQAAA